MADTLKKINYLTEEQYKNAKENGEINENEIYLTPDYETLEYSRILWVNPAPNAAQFSPQEITFSSDDYDFFDILYYCYYDVHTVECARVYKEHTPANLTTTFQYNNRLYGGHRTITKIDDKKYSISSVQCNPFGGTGSDTTNDWIIPVIVYGGKVQRKSNENINIAPSVYSLEETIIGEFMGKVLYRKCYRIDSFPNAGNQYFASGVSSIEKVINVGGFANSASLQETIFIQGAYNSNIHDAIVYEPYRNYIRLHTTNDRSSYSGYIWIEYTKTTD